MKHIGTQPFDTYRLILRPFVSLDGEAMLKNWAADPNIQNEYGEPVYSDIHQVNDLLQKYISSYSSLSSYRWAIIEKSSGENIGQIAFCKVWEDCRTAEIEYCIGQNFQGHGYAGEALSAVIRYTFSFTDFDKLEAYHRAENTKSGRVLEKSEMHKTDTVQRFIHEGIVPKGEVCYCINKDEFNK